MSSQPPKEACVLTTIDEAVSMSMFYGSYKPIEDKVSQLKPLNDLDVDIILKALRYKAENKPSESRKYYVYALQQLEA